MFGFSSISEFPISDFPLVVIPPPPPAQVSGTDGYTDEEQKRYRETEKRLEAAKRVRDRARRAAKENLRQIVGEQVDPEKYKKKPAKKVAKKERPILTTKPLPELEASVADLQAQLHQLAYAIWQKDEYVRLQEVARIRRMHEDDEEALLLLL